MPTPTNVRSNRSTGTQSGRVKQVLAKRKRPVPPTADKAVEPPTEPIMTSEELAAFLAAKAGEPWTEEELLAAWRAERKVAECDDALREYHAKQGVF